MRNSGYIRAHEYSSNHRREIPESEKCGCFYCLTIFNSTEITEWIDEIDEIGQTALFPGCNIDSVIGSKSGFPINREFLELMRQHWFENLIITDFIKWGVNLEIPPSFYFWEKSLASEIDMVISVGGMIIPVEIKYSSEWSNKYLHGIDMFKEKHNKKGITIPFSLIIYRGDFLMLREDVFVIPV